MKKFLVVLGLILAFALLLGCYFGMIAGAVWVICWAFKIAFAWRYVVGVYIVFLILGGGGISIQIGR